MKKIKLGVVGCGVLGSRHADIYSKMANVDLVGVYDVHPERAQKIAEAALTKSFPSMQALSASVEALSVCTPAQTHHDVAMPLLEDGRHLLVEKPLTTKLEDADDLVQAAKRKNLILQVGHVERFNAAVKVMKDIVKNPRFIECDRIGPYDPRIQDIGVVLDLMIHDIDIVLHLVDSKVKSVDTIAVNIMSPTEDFANCRITFENGAVCSLTASRIARDRLRKIRIFQENAYLSLDYVRQEAVILMKENGSTAYRTIEIQKTQPLQDELADFVACVQKNERPSVPGEDGRAALAVALQVLDQIAAAKK